MTTPTDPHKILKDLSAVRDFLIELCKAEKKDVAKHLRLRAYALYQQYPESFRLRALFGIQALEEIGEALKRSAQEDKPA